jgi:hypothetical protein
MVFYGLFAPFIDVEEEEEASQPKINRAFGRASWIRTNLFDINRRLKYLLCYLQSSFFP